eukprot:3400748-Amphidinium_carterae.1
MTHAAPLCSSSTKKRQPNPRAVAAKPARAKMSGALLFSTCMIMAIELCTSEPLWAKELSNKARTTTNIT